MRMLFRVLPLAALLAPFGPFRALEAEPCRFLVSVTDMYGHRVPAQQIRLAGTEKSIDIQQDTFVDSPCGEHTLEVTAAGARPERIVFNLHQAQQVVTVALGLGMLEGPAATCSVLGVNAGNGATRIRLLQPFGNYSVDVPIARGAFAIRNIDCGSYLLIVMGRSACLGTMVVTITAATGGVAKIDLKREQLSEVGCTSIRQPQ